LVTKGIYMKQLTILFLLLTSMIYAEEQFDKNELNIEKISKTLGYMIRKNLSESNLNINIEQVISGIQDSQKGLRAPLTEEEYNQAIISLQEEKFKNESKKNLMAAESFLKENAENENIICKEDNKLQYVIISKGKGPEVKEHFSPLVKYRGTFLNGEEFDHSEMVFDLEETIPGFKKGLIGMKEGEKRKIFIHPDLGYGTSTMFPPNSLLCFEVEILNSNQSQDTKQIAFEKESIR